MKPLTVKPLILGAALLSITTSFSWAAEGQGQQEEPSVYIFKVEDLKDPKGCSLLEEFLRDKKVKSIEINEAGECVIEIEKEVVDAALAASVEKATIVEVVEKGIFKGWDGRLSLSGLVTQGNSDTTRFGTTLEADKSVKGDDKIQLKLGVDYLEDSDESFLKLNASLRYDQKVDERRSRYLLLSLSKDEAKNINFASEATVGLRYYLTKRLAVEAGLGVRYEDTTESEETDVVANYGLTYERMLTEKLKLKSSAKLNHPVFDDYDDLRGHIDLGIEAPLGDKWRVEIKVIEDYQAEPAGDAERSDERLQIGFGRDF